MRLFNFFESEQIIRNCEFRNTYAQGKYLLKSIAFAERLIDIEKLNEDKSVAVIITLKDLIDAVAEEKGVVLSKNPRYDFYMLHNKLVDNNLLYLSKANNIHSTARISSHAIIKRNVQIGKNVTIGDYSIIESDTIIGNDCFIGHHVIIGAGSMQNSMCNDKLVRLNFAGGVKIGDRTQVLHGAIIQKPYQAFYTEIGTDCTISTNVVIGHGSTIGNNTLISGNAAMAGNCTIGNKVWIGGGAMLSDGITVSDSAKIVMGSVVIKNVSQGQTVSGNFAINHKTNLRNQLNK